jgi:hypothetical protein
MGPLAVIQDWPGGVVLLVSMLLGFAFGFVLEQSGFGNAKKLAYQFYFKDLTVFKVFFGAILTAMVGLVIFGAFGWIDLSSIYQTHTYLGAGIIGAIIMGAGFAIGGYCPGTSIAGLATFKVDALFYIIGAFLGVIIFQEAYALFEPIYSGKYSGAKGAITIYEAIGIRAGVLATAILVAALLMFWGAEIIEKKWGNKVEA